MPYYTPLRYPGGKRRLAQVINLLLEENNLHDIQYAESYAGGAAVALALLIEERASAIHINDLSRPVYAFWHAVLNDTTELCRRITHADLSIEEWRKQRDVYQDHPNADLLDLGFAALFMNRTNRSGILNGGVIGGLKQTGAWKLDARWNPVELIQRIRRIARYKTRIHLHQLDALDFTKTVVSKLDRGFAFYDPPYIEKGEELYMNAYDLKGHRAVASAVSKLKQPWLVTYDLAAVDENLYPQFRRLIYGLQYSARDSHEGREVMFLSNGLVLPRTWKQRATITLTPPRCRYPLFGKLQPPPRNRTPHAHR